MGLEYACFISYRQGRYDLMKRFVDQFFEALAGELETLTDLPVYRDTRELRGGEYYNEELARSLCESACMILIYTPTYFSSAHPYCTREYLAMLELENKRNGYRPGRENQGLIIPVVLRGFDQLPHEISGRIIARRFDKFSLSEAPMISNPRYSEEIQWLAKYISERCQELRGAPIDCSKYQMPDESAAVAEAGRLEGRPAPFPGRDS